MKFIAEYRDADLVAQYMDEIRRTATRPWTIMEVCGGQTHSLVKNGKFHRATKVVDNIWPQKAKIDLPPERAVSWCSIGSLTR